MLKAHLGLEGIKDGFDDEALAQHDLVSHGHQVVSHVPADTLANARMYSYTVRQGGKAGGGGRWRHWQPVRTRWNRPSRRRRMSVVRGRPPGLAGGIRGASRAYCSSLKACPAPKSPT